MTSQDGLFGRSLLCHPILKFSHSTLPRLASPTGWSHIQAPDIYAIVEQLDHTTDIQLRVIQGTNDLEVLPLTAIIQQARDLHERQPNTLPDNLPIFGLTKGTALAIRYFYQNNQVRRIQLRFENDACCSEAVSLLVHHGLMFSMPNNKQNTQPQPQARPVTANSYMTRQNSVQPARFDRDTSSIIVPSVQETFHPSLYTQQQEDQHAANQANVSNMHMMTSSSTPKTYQTQNIQRQPTFAPIRTSEEPPTRPSTAPIQRSSDEVSRLFPPRRELPFPKPSSSPAKTKMLPPLPKPSYASDATKSAAAEKKEEPQTRMDLEKPPVHPQITRLSTPQGPTRFEPPMSRTYNFQAKDDGMAVDSQSPIYSDTSTSTMCGDGNVLSEPNRLANTSPGVNMLSSLERATHSNSDQVYSSSPERAFPSSPERSRNSSPLAGRGQMQQDVEMTTVPSQPQSAEEDLQRYAEQSNDVRADAINKFILESIDNDCFLKLCVDIEACWRRTALDRRV